MKTIIGIILFAAIGFSQTVPVALGTINVPTEAAIAFESQRLSQTAPLATAITLGADITTGSLTFPAVGNLAQLAVGQQILIDTEAFTVSAISGQNLTVASRPTYVIGGVTLSRPAAHTSGTSIQLLQWPSAIAGFKALILASVQNVLTNYCPTHPTICPTLNTQYAAITAAQNQIAAIMAQVVQ
jgi:hypothetical protein